MATYEDFHFSFLPFPPRISSPSPPLPQPSLTLFSNNLICNYSSSLIHEHSISVSTLPLRLINRVRPSPNLSSYNSPNKPRFLTLPKIYHQLDLPHSSLPKSLPSRSSPGVYLPSNVPSCNSQNSPAFSHSLMIILIASARFSKSHGGTPAPRCLEQEWPLLCFMSRRHPNLAMWK